MASAIENNEKKSYRGIFKATSLFGGVQAYQIIIEIIKSKFIAILLGPTGVGMQGLFTSATQMIQNLTSFGLSQSAIRNVAEANGTGDKTTIGKTVTALRKLVWYTGLLGMVVTILFSPLLSQTSFGDNTYIWSFIFLSVILLINQINAGQRVILQGTRQFKYLAKCTAYGVTVGLIVSVPLYYLWGVKAIVPNLVISSLTSLALSWYYSSKVPVESVQQSTKETFKLGRSMLTMGMTMSLTHFITIASSYILRSCIRYWGGIEAVGLFSAGFLLMSQYTGLVFQAMGTDFYPRLAAVNQDNEKCRQVMNQQGEIGLLLLGPLMVLCIVFIPIVIRILYSEEFLAVNDYVVWCAVGVIFQMASWAVSYVFVAKAESKLFAINELSVGVYSLALNLLGYYFGGLTGLGISFMVKYLIYLLQIFTIANRRYGFNFNQGFIKIFAVQLCVVLSAVLIVSVIPSFWKYAVGALLSICAILYSYNEMNKRMDISGLLKKKLRKR